MSNFTLPKLQRNLPLVRTEYPSQEFHIWWQRVADALIDTINTQQDQIDDLITLARRDKRTASYTSPTAVLTATDVGASITITVANHTRIYSDASTLAITGGTLPGLAYNTPYTVYYDDTTLTVTNPTFHASTTIADGNVGAADGRHVLGVIQTPAIGGTANTGGGAYPPGFTVGGELP